MTLQKILTSDEAQDILSILQDRFEKHMSRHQGIDWSLVTAKLQMNPTKLWSLAQMEATGWEPDIIEIDQDNNTFIFIDCAPESPLGRRSLCYDQEALASRKENKPKNSTLQMAGDMGVDILTEEEYRMLQSFWVFDLKTSSWIATPSEIRKLGGALFCDRRYNQVFTYHNGAESYYAARGFRGSLKV